MLNIRTSRLGLFMAALMALAVGACGTLEPSSADLIKGASSKMQTAKTVHIDGTGSIGLKGGFSMSFDFKMSGDLEMPDRSRMNLEMSFFGQNVNVEMITVGGMAYAKDPTTGVWTSASTGSSTPMASTLFPSDPINSLDLSKVSGVVEVDRPVVDGKQTRHLRYTADTTQMADAMRKAAGSSPVPFRNPSGVGEVWIRVDDGQIVRQSVKVTMEMDDIGGALFGALPGASAAPSSAKAMFEMAFDFRFSNHGQPVPAITAPPVGR